MSELHFLNEELDKLKSDDLYRSMRTLTSGQGPLVEIDGRLVVCLCSNNYLGLAERKELRLAAIEAAKKYGTGAGASRLISGNLSLHEELEEELASFKGSEAALVFPTGYMANLGTICALVEKEDLVIGDRLNHASIIDACRLSGATFRVYPHKDMEALERILLRSREFRRRLIVTDAVFSMDGDVAPLREIVELAVKHVAILMVDEAHGMGVLGENGRGASEELGVEDRIDVNMGTLSKAAGCHGGYVSGRRELIELLKNKARTFIYTTGMSPPVCGAAMAALQIIRDEPDLRQRLKENSQLVRRSLGYGDAEIPTPIIPVVVGEASAATELSAFLLESGTMLPAIRPPTVPVGTSRLRVSVMATHTREQLKGACKQIKEGLTRFGSL